MGFQAVRRGRDGGNIEGGHEGDNKGGELLEPKQEGKIGRVHGSVLQRSGLRQGRADNIGGVQEGAGVVPRHLGGPDEPG